MTTYRADIDGLRALAILTVMLFHFGVGAVSGGFVGVDIFFVISGYLIARILHEDLAAGRFSILSFYERRIRRIFPALLASMLLTWVVAWLLILPPDFERFSQSFLASAGFVSNLYFWKHSGYFDSSAQLKPLLHTWSLAIEEQFYLFMPIAMMVIHRYMRKRWLWLLPVALASLLLSTYALSVGPTANFFLLPTRTWELLCGALLALCPPRALSSRWKNTGLALLGLAAIGVAAFTYTEATPFPGPAALLPCLGAAALIYVGGHQTTLVHRALSTPLMAGIGRISYSLYLIHWPVAVFVRYVTLRDPTLRVTAGMMLGSVVWAIASWRWVEQPFRHPLHGASRPQVLGAGMLMVALLAVIGISGMLTHGFAHRFVGYVSPAKEHGNAWRNGRCFFEEKDDIGDWNARDCTLTHQDGETVLLWGDSYAAHYAPGITANAQHIPYRVLQYTYAGCPPALSYYSYARPRCQQFNQHALDIIRTEHVTRVILSARWVDLQLRGLETLQSTIAAMHALDVEVSVIGQSPIFATTVRDIAYRKVIDTWPSTIPSELNARLQSAIAPVHLIDPTAALCHEGRCTLHTDGQFLYSDEGHLSLAGSSLAVRAYVPLF